jgi:hypothetical protein
MSDFDDEDDKTLVDWDRKLLDFRAATEPGREYGPCPHHAEDVTELCENCDISRCSLCLDSCPCLAMEAKGIYLSFGCITRCCFCGVVREKEGDPVLIHARARWGHAYAHSGCILIRANRLATNLEKVLAKPEPLPDVFSLVFDKTQVCPEVFAEVDRAKIMLWCESQEAKDSGQHH